MLDSSGKTFTLEGIICAYSVHVSCLSENVKATKVERMSVKMGRRNAASSSNLNVVKPDVHIKMQFFFSFMCTHIESYEVK